MNPPFAVQKLGHVVVNVTDIEASKRFYTEVLGFRISDIYGGDKMPGGMVFLRCNGDHHCLALIGGLPAEGEVKRTLHHIAFELATLDEVFRARDHLQKYGAKIVFEGRRRAGCQIAIEFRDPDGNNLEIYWNIDQVGTEGIVRPASEWRPAKTLEEAVGNPVKGQPLPQRG